MEKAANLRDQERRLTQRHPGDPGVVQRSNFVLEKETLREALASSAIDARVSSSVPATRRISRGKSDCKPVHASCRCTPSRALKFS